MAVHIKIPKNNIGPLTFGKEAKFKIKLFPFVTLIQEVHLVGIGFMSKPITKLHDRWVKVLNEHEVYVFKNDLNNCYVCSHYYGRIRTEDINHDPHVSKIFSWQP